MADTFPSLFWSYTIVWTFLALYIFWLGFRLSKLERKLTMLKDEADEQRQQSSPN